MQSKINMDSADMKERWSPLRATGQTTRLTTTKPHHCVDLPGLGKLSTLILSVV